MRTLHQQEAGFSHQAGRMWLWGGGFERDTVWIFMRFKYKNWSQKSEGSVMNYGGNHNSETWCWSVFRHVANKGEWWKWEDQTQHIHHVLSSVKVRRTLQPAVHAQFLCQHVVLASLNVIEVYQSMHSLCNSWSLACDMPSTTEGKHDSELPPAQTIVPSIHFHAQPLRFQHVASLWVFHPDTLPGSERDASERQELLNMCEALSMRIDNIVPLRPFRAQSLEDTTCSNVWDTCSFHERMVIGHHIKC